MLIEFYSISIELFFLEPLRVVLTVEESIIPRVYLLTPALVLFGGKIVAENSLAEFGRFLNLCSDRFFFCRCCNTNLTSLLLWSFI